METVSEKMSNLNECVKIAKVVKFVCVCVCVCAADIEKIYIIFIICINII